MLYMLVYKNQWGAGLTSVGDILEDMRETMALAKAEKIANPSRQYIILEGKDSDGLDRVFRDVAEGRTIPQTLTSDFLTQTEAAGEPGGDHDEVYVYKNPYRDYHMNKVSKLLSRIADGTLGGPDDGTEPQ